MRYTLLLCIILSLAFTVEQFNSDQHLQMPYKKEGLTEREAAEHLLGRLSFGARPGAVEKVLAIYKACGIDLWANALKEQYLEKAFLHLEEIAVSKERKASLVELAHYLIKRDK